jgi:hypothetical protein
LSADRPGQATGEGQQVELSDELRALLELARAVGRAPYDVGALL